MENKYSSFIIIIKIYNLFNRIGVITKASRKYNVKGMSLTNLSIKIIKQNVLIFCYVNYIVY